MAAQIPPPSSLVPNLPKELDAILARGLAAEASNRYETAREMALVLEGYAPRIRPSEVGAWVEGVAAETLAQRARLLTMIEHDSPEPPETGTAVHAVDSESQRGAGGLKTPFDAPAGAVSGSRSKPSFVPPAAEPVRNAPVTRVHAEPGVPTDTTAVTESEGVKRPPKRRAFLGVSVALLLLAVAAAGALYLRETQAPVAANAASASAPAVTSGAPEVAPQAEKVAAPHADEKSAPEVSASSPTPASATAEKSKVTPHDVLRSAAPSGAAHPAHAAKPAANCDPPYSVDAAGRHIFKVECM